MNDTVWRETISLKAAVKLKGFDAQQEAIISAIHDSNWWKQEGEGSELDSALQHFAEAATWDAANSSLAWLYDLADKDGIWLETF